MMLQILPQSEAAAAQTHRRLEEVILDSSVVVQRLADAHQAQVNACGAASRQLLPVWAHCAAQRASDVRQHVLQLASAPTARLPGQSVHTADP